MDNLLMLTDSYKVTHFKQYPKDSEVVYSYFESRGGLFKELKFFGLQYFLKRYLKDGFTLSDVNEAEAYFQDHFMGDVFNKDGFLYILNKHGGQLPVRIKAVTEGCIYPVLTPLITIENTDEKCFWLTNYLETLLVQTWFPTTVATLSYKIRCVILDFLEKTGDPSLIDFKLHDFGFRGVSSPESAGLGGMAHLLNFKGTDTLNALVYAKKYYSSVNMPAFSIPASEHSTITSWGSQNEKEAMKNMLEQYPSGLVACVSDSYDIYKACSDIWGDELRQDVLSRKGTLVIRPDSGNPEEVVLKVLEILGDKFGVTVNQKGYKVLPDCVRVIQGDGVDFNSITSILQIMKIRGWSADNIAFGMGGALLQKIDRDTQKFAFKCSAIKRNGNWQDVFKKPVTAGFKQSKAGRFDGMETVFENGEIVKEYAFDDIKI